MACRPTPTVTSVKKQTNTTKCGRCLTCRTPSRKQACLIGRCKDLAEKGSATARLAAQGNDLKGAASHPCSTCTSPTLRLQYALNGLEDAAAGLPCQFANILMEIGRAHV